jgi:hypothetical protein
MPDHRNIIEKMSGLLMNLVNRLRSRLSQREESSGTLLERIGRAGAALQEQRYARAEQIYPSVPREHPLHPRAQTNLAIALSGSAQAFRQPRLGDWKTPVAECATTLRNCARDKTASSGAI